MFSSHESSYHIMSFYLGGHGQIGQGQQQVTVTAATPQNVAAAQALNLGQQTPVSIVQQGQSLQQQVNYIQTH